MAWKDPDWIWQPPLHCFGTFKWVEDNNGKVPPGAVQAGVDEDDGPIYVGRAWESGDLLPAKVCPTHNGAFVSYSGCEISKFQYQVLVSDNIAWEGMMGGEVVVNAVGVGRTSDGEPLYAGRAVHEDTITVGKVHPSHNCLYISWAGRELRKEEYEIMVLE